MGNIYHSWNGTVLTITSDSGTSSADLKGAIGVRGPQGPYGILYDAAGNEVNGYVSTEYFESMVSVLLERMSSLEEELKKNDWQEIEISAVLGEAILGEAIIGDAGLVKIAPPIIRLIDDSKLPRLTVPTIYLTEEAIPQLETPVIYLEGGNPRLAAPIIYLYERNLELAAPVIRVEDTQLATPRIYPEVV